MKKEIDKKNKRKKPQGMDWCPLSRDLSMLFGMNIYIYVCNYSCLLSHHPFSPSLSCLLNQDPLSPLNSFTVKVGSFKVILMRVQCFIM